MIIEDVLYGKENITSKVIIELINSSPLQRLKGISQLGLPSRYYFISIGSRYVHSLGVMIILKRLGASEKEQIAGLLHDVSHTAFSHIVDWVVGSFGKDDFQDRNHLEILKKSDINNILTKYGYDVEEIANLLDFSLLDKKIPDLCADRFDYALREFPSNVVKPILDSVKNFDNKMVFDNEDAAYMFSTNFLQRQKLNWGSYEGSMRYKLFAEIIKRAIEIKIIEFNDLWKDDEYILQKLEESNDLKIRNIFEILNHSSLPEFNCKKEKVNKKLRYVDPEIITNNGKLVRLSALRKDFFDELENLKKDSAEGMLLPILNF